MSDHWGHFRSTEDQSHPEQAQAKRNQGTPPESGLESIVCGIVGDGRILQEFISQSFIFREAKSIAGEVFVWAGCNTCALLRDKLICTEKSLGSVEYTDWPSLQATPAPFFVQFPENLLSKAPKNMLLFYLYSTCSKPQ